GRDDPGLQPRPGLLPRRPSGGAPRGARRLRDRLGPLLRRIRAGAGLLGRDADEDRGAVDDGLPRAERRPSRGGGGRLALHGPGRDGRPARPPLPRACRRRRPVGAGVISLKGVSVRSGEFSLSRVAFDIPAGGYGVLMGKTGSGKTTLLETICGLRDVEEGSVWLDGQDVTLLRPADRGIGYVPQDRALFQ